MSFLHSLRDVAGGARLRGASLPRALALVWKAAPGLAAAWAVLIVLQGLLPAAIVQIVRRLVDDLASLVGSAEPSRAAGALLVPALLLGALVVLGEALRSGSAWLRLAQAERLRDFMSDLVHERSAAVDLAFYDSPGFFDRLHRARDEAAYRPVALLEAAGGIVESAVTTLALAIVLVPYGAALPLLLAASTLPALAVVLHHGLRQHRWRIEKSADERRSWYYDWLLTGREAAAELRWLDLSGPFRSRYQEIRRGLRRGRMRLAREHGAAEVAAGIGGLLVAGGTMAWMVLRAVAGMASLGDLALFYQAFSQAQGRMRSLLEDLGRLYANSLFLRDLFEFLDLEPRIVSPGRPKPAPDALAEGIRFRGVHFAYPGGRRPVFERFSLFVPAGRVTAILGENGAGKSTIAKLLCRLHEPAEGRIEIDGIDLRDMDPRDLRGRLSILFQRPVRYSDTVAVNVALADLQAARESSLRELEKAIHEAGASDLIGRLPTGISTMLGKSFADGEELSEGEWQRIALARALYRRAPILILDEPTSAMDPWSEVDWASRLASIANGRTVILITHRPATAAAADAIHVMEGGRIVESGTHEELKARAGRYARLWRQDSVESREIPLEDPATAGVSSS